MLTKRSVVWIFSIATMVSGAGMTCSQPFPNKPIRIITSEQGGGTDFATRLIAQRLADPLGQPVIIENRPSIINGEIVAKASPDGYTLVIGNSGLWIQPLMKNTPYDPVRDLAPISMLARSPNVLTAHPELPAKSVKELIALAKAKPGALNYGSSGEGTSNHLGMELFKFMAGVNIVRVNYKGAGPALTALIGGEVQLYVASSGVVAPQLKSGKLRALAVTSAQPSALVPELPTVAASGLPGYELISIYAMFAPAKVPDAVIRRLNQEVVRVLGRPDVKDKFFNVGVETVGSTPDQLAISIKSEMARMGKVIKTAGIHAE